MKFDNYVKLFFAFFDKNFYISNKRGIIMLSNRIKKIRKILDLTQTEFGNKLQIPFSTISRYENGEVKPGFDVLYKIGKIYDVNMNWLFTGEGSMFKGSGNGAVNVQTKIAELEAEVTRLKKEISKLEKDNKTLNTELLGRLRELLRLHKKLELSQIRS